MERHSDSTSHLFQDEDRRMAGVQARKEEEKKRESHKQTIHKVPLWAALLLLSLSAWIYNLNVLQMNVKACISDGVLGTQECLFIPWLLCDYFENVKNIISFISEKCWMRFTASFGILVVLLFCFNFANHNNKKDI